MILKLRSYLLILIICLSMALYFIVPITAKIIASEKTTYMLATAWGRFVTWAIKVVIGIDYRVSGAENIPLTPCVVLSKHQSALDIFLLLTVFHPQSWVMKKELLRIPFFGWVLSSVNPIAIDRNAGRKALMIMIEGGIKKLKQGYFIVMYPEGTRAKIGEKIEYKTGGMFLAKKAGVDIVPVALNTGLFWVKGKGIQSSGTVDIVVGKPISSQNDIEILAQQVEEWIETTSFDLVKNHPLYLKNNNI